MATKKKMTRTQKAAAAAALAFIVGAAPAAGLADDFTNPDAAVLAVAEATGNIAQTATFTTQTGVPASLARTFTNNNLVLTFDGADQAWGAGLQTITFEAASTTGNSIVLETGDSFAGNITFTSDAAANGVTFTNKGTVTGITTFGAGNDTLVASGVFSDDVVMGAGDDILTITAGSTTASGKTIDGGTQATADTVKIDGLDISTVAVAGGGQVGLNDGSTTTEIKGFEKLEFTGADNSLTVKTADKATAFDDIELTLGTGTTLTAEASDDVITAKDVTSSGTIDRELEIADGGKFVAKAGSAAQAITYAAAAGDFTYEGGSVESVTAFATTPTGTATLSANGTIADLEPSEAAADKFSFTVDADNYIGSINGFKKVTLGDGSNEATVVNESTKAFAAFDNGVSDGLLTVAHKATLQNKGTLGAVTVNGADAAFVNMEGATAGAVALTSGTVTVDGGEVASITGDAAADIVTINEGKVTGGISLKGEDDILTVTGGEVVGAIDLGAGANTFTMTGGKVAGVTGGADSDTVSISGTSVAGVINLGDTATNEFTITGGEVTTVNGGNAVDIINLGGGKIGTIDLGVGNDTINLISDTTDATVTFADADVLNINASGEITDLDPAASKNFAFGKTTLKGFTAVALAGAMEKAIVVTNKSETALATEVTPTVGDFATLNNEGTLGTVVVDGIDAEFINKAGATVGKADKDATVLTVTAGNATNEGSILNNSANAAVSVSDGIFENKGTITNANASKLGVTLTDANSKFVNFGAVDKVTFGDVETAEGAGVIQKGGTIDNITGGASIDNVLVEDGIVKDIDLAAGDDNVTISGGTVGDVTLGAGADTFTITAGTVNSLDASADINNYNLGGGTITEDVTLGAALNVVTLNSDTTDATVILDTDDTLKIAASGEITDLDPAASKNFAFGKTTLKGFTAVSLAGALEKAIVVTNKSETALATEVTPTVGDFATLKNEGTLGAVTVAGDGAMFENVSGTAGDVTLNGGSAKLNSGSTTASVTGTNDVSDKVIIAGGELTTLTVIAGTGTNVDVAELAIDGSIDNVGGTLNVTHKLADNTDQTVTLTDFETVAIGEGKTLTVNDADTTDATTDNESMASASLSGLNLAVEKGATVAGGTNAATTTKKAIDGLTGLNDVDNFGTIGVDVTIADDDDNMYSAYAGSSAQTVTFAGAGELEFDGGSIKQVVASATSSVSLGISGTIADHATDGDFTFTGAKGSIGQVTGAEQVDIYSNSPDDKAIVTNTSEKALDGVAINVLDATLENSGTITVSDSKALTVAGTVVNTGTIEATGTAAINNAGRFVNRNLVKAGSAGVIKNSGVFANAGTIQTENDLTVTGDGKFYITNSSKVVAANGDTKDVTLADGATLGFFENTTVSEFNKANETDANTQYLNATGITKLAVAQNATLTVDSSTVKTSGTHDAVTAVDISRVSAYEDSKAIVTGSVVNTGHAMALDAEDNSTITVEKAADGVTSAFEASTIEVKHNATLAINREATTSGTVNIKGAASLLLGADMTADGVVNVNGYNGAEGVATLDLGTSMLDAGSHAVTFGDNTPGDESSAQLVTTVEYDKAAKANKNGKITTTGNITFSNTSVNVKVADNAVDQDGIIIAESTAKIEDNGVTLASADSAFYTLRNFGLSQDEMSLTFDLDIKDATQFAAEGVNVNDAFAMKTVFGNDPRLANTALLKKAIDEAHPEPFSGAVTSVINANASARNVINTHVANARGMSSGSEDAQWKLWGQFFGNSANESAHDGGTAYDSNTLGITFGVDRALLDNFRLGFAYTYMNTNVDSKDSANENDIDTHLFTLYSDYTFGKGWYLDGHASYGFNKYDVDRYMTVLTDKASADFDGYTLNFGAEIGKDFMVEKVVVTPFLAADYSYISTESYSEHGAGKSNLIVDDQNNNIFETALGVRLSGTFNKFTPEFRVAWVQDWAGENVVTNGTFAAGPALSDSSVERDQTNIAVGAGLDYQITDAFKLGADFDFLGSAHRESYGGAFNATYEF